MNILWITPDVPFNKQYGGSLDISARMEFASRCGHRIYLIGFTKEPLREEVWERLNEYCAGVNIIQRPRISLHMANPLLPYSASSRYSGSIIDMVRSAVHNSGIDVACLESVHVGETAPILRKEGIPLVLRLHNLESHYFSELGKSYGYRPMRLVYMWEAMKLIEYERSIYRQSQRILCVSNYEAEQLSRLYPDAYIKWLPIPVKLEADADERGDSGPIIAFSGSMYLPNNVEAAVWFANKVFPKILISVPDAEFWIIGRSPSREIRALGTRPNIRITGEVPNSHQLLSRARVIVVPLFHGAGVKIKILEGIGLGKLVVSTSQAILGTSLVNSQQVLLADDPESFAALCIRALEKPELFYDLRDRALDYYLKYHTMEAVGSIFISELSCFEPENRGILDGEN